MPGIGDMFIIIGSINALVLLFALLSLSRLRSESLKLNRETFGLLKKVEGLTAQKHHLLAKQFDDLIEKMANQVPVIVGKEATSHLFEIERQIITRLAELEPNLKTDPKAIAHMEEVLRKVELLEEEVIRSTSKAVEKILVEKRKTLFQPQAEVSSL